MIDFAAPQVELPEFYRVVQHFETSGISEVAASVRRELEGVDWAARVTSGQTVAVAVGSRGICGLRDIVAEVVAALKKLDLKPFVIPAMGSHGGATADGQRGLLRELGITEETVHAPVESSMEVVSFGKLPGGCEVFFSADAFRADHVFIINRVKPHTAFRGEIESGLCKMLAVGCGKHHGALAMHTHNLAVSLVPAAERIIQRARILGGLAIVEDSLDHPHTLKSAAPQDFAAVDHELLALARRMLPRIPIDELDVLVVDEIGKNVSGAGMDPNVIGFWRRDGGERQPNFRTLIVLDITRQSHGNALGIGMADMTTRRVYDQIDFAATYTNALTSGIWASARMPIVMPDDLSALSAAISKVPELGTVRMARIRNTLNLETIWVTRSVLPELEGRPDLSIDPQPVRAEFDTAGRWVPFNTKMPAFKAATT